MNVVGCELSEREVSLILRGASMDAYNVINISMQAQLYTQKIKWMML